MFAQIVGLVVDIGLGALALGLAYQNRADIKRIKEHLGLRE